jgi:hypothetical protein
MKKKELVGNYRNAGSDWRPKGAPQRVKVHEKPAARDHACATLEGPDQAYGSRTKWWTAGPGRNGVSSPRTHASWPARKNGDSGWPL